MRWLLWLTVGLVVVVAALPFIVLSAMGFMRPTEGFCVESVGLTWEGLADSPAAQEQEQSFFVSPELADPTIRVPLGAISGSASDGVDWRWPVCLRTRHAEHQILAGYYDWQLGKLGEPNLRHAARTGGVYRVLTSPSFSRVPIAFRLEVSAPSGEGTLHSAWLEEDGTKPAYTKTTGDEAWWNAKLPRRSLQRRLGAQQTRALQALFDDPPLISRSVLMASGLSSNPSTTAVVTCVRRFYTARPTQPAASSAQWRTSPGYRKKCSPTAM